MQMPCQIRRLDSGSIVQQQVEHAMAKSKVTGLADWAQDACARVKKSPQVAPTVLVVVLAWELGVLFFEASKKLFWYDELLTVHVSSLQPFSLFLKALRAGVDGMPLGYYLVVRAVRMLPGDPHVILRLPSILGYLMTLLGVYWFARKRLPAIAGLAAVLLITLSPFRDYAIEARSYSLLVGLLAISAVLWQRIGEKRFMAPLFVLFLTLAVSSHQLAVVVISAFGVAELTWIFLSRRIRWWVWIACLFATSPFFLSLPILLHYREVFGKNFWARPSWFEAIRTYGFYLGINPKLALVLIAFFGIVASQSLLRMIRKPGGEGSPVGRDFEPHEIILFSGFLYFPAILVVLTVFLHSGYHARYGWPGILGLVLGTVYLVRSIWFKSHSTYLLMALLIGFACQGGIDVMNLHKASSGRADERWTSLAELSRSEPDIPVVIGSPIAYLEATEYSPPELRSRLVEVVDADNATRLIGADTADKTDLLLAQFIPLHVEDLAAFQVAHQKFILRSGGADDWFTLYLVEKGYHLSLLSKDSGPGSSIYIAER